MTLAPAKAARRAAMLLALLAPAAGAGQPLPAAAELERRGLAAWRENCQSDGYDRSGCQEAVRLLEQALQRDPKLTEAQLALASARWNQSFDSPKESPRRAALQSQALGTYQRMVDAGVRDVRPYYQLSVRKTNPAQRMQLLEKAVQIDPNHAAAHRDLAGIYLKLQRFPDAVRTYQRFQDLRPRADVEDARTDVSFAGKLAAVNRKEDAVRIYQKTLEQTQAVPRSRRCQVFRNVNPDQYQGMGDLSGKLKALLPACTNIEAYERALKLERQGQTDQAIRALESQVRANPEHAESHLMLERLYLKRGDAAKATEAVRRYTAGVKDPEELCRRFKADPRMREALDAATREKLQRDCR